MLKHILIAMQMTDKLGILFVLLLFCLIPLAVFNENPGLTPTGCLQIVVIAATVIGALLWFPEKKILGRLVIAFVAYMVATCLSNLAAMMLIPDLLH